MTYIYFNFYIYKYNIIPFCSISIGPSVIYKVLTQSLLAIILKVYYEMTNIISGEAKKKRNFQFDIDAELDQQFRKYVYDKHEGYRKGLLTQELELLLKHGMECENK